MLLSVLISTINEGINRVPNLVLSFRPDIEYVICHQYTSEKPIEIPHSLIRDDIKIIHLEGKGLSRSRNCLIDCARGDVCLIADDDVKYKFEYFDEIINTYSAEVLDVVLFQVNTNDPQREFKNYSKNPLYIKKHTDISPSSIEITFKRESIHANNIYFDIRFGLGTQIKGGEEILFLYNCLKHHLKVKFVNKFIVEHPYESSGKTMNMFGSEIARVTGATDAYINGVVSLPKSFFGTIKNLDLIIKSSSNPFVYFYSRFRSALYILLTNYQNFRVKG